MTPEISRQKPAAALPSAASRENAAQPPAKRGESPAAAESRPAEITPRALVEQFHADYVRWSGVAVTLREGAFSAWWALHLDRGSDADKLREEIKVVCVYLREQINRDKRNPGALRLCNLLQPEQFDADVAEARMMLGKRAPKGPNGRKAAPDAAPPGWRAFLEDQYPDHAPQYRDQPFDALPGQLQRACQEGCR